MSRFYYVFFLAALLPLLSSCDKKINDKVAFVEKQLKYCEVQARKTIDSIENDSLLPRSIEKEQESWNYVKYTDWTSGFWPGILWYLYEYTQDEYWKKQADRFNQLLAPLSTSPATDHDLGFQVFCSFGNGYRLTQDTAYKAIVIRTADTLATLYNPKVGTILSWPAMVTKMNWPHNTIIDNMMNLELLFWAGKVTGDTSMLNIARNHALKTMQNQFRDDYSVYHVVVYDTLNGQRIKRVTHQGYSDESLWARGQAWAIYGFVMTYRESGNVQFLDFAEKVANVYLERLPENKIPFWDFEAPNIPYEPKDASAAAVAASALFELSTYVTDSIQSDYYFNSAEVMLQNLSTEKYQSRDNNPAFLMHSTGHKPNNSEVDVSINYADYYYIEALMRYRELLMNNKKSDLLTQNNRK